VSVEALNTSAGSWGIGNLKAYVDRFGLFHSDAVVLQIGTHDLLQTTSTSEVVGQHPSYPNKNPTLAVQELWERDLWPRYLRPHLKPYLSWLRGKNDSGKTASKDHSKNPERQLARNLEQLRVLVNDIRAAQMPVVIVHTPNRGEVVGRTDGPYLSEKRRRFLELADSLRVPVLNLAELWARRSGVSDYYRDHVHLNERGNRALSDTLAGLLHEELGTLCSEARP